MTARATAGEIIDVCVEAQPHPPYYYPDRDGSLQILQKMAAARAGYTLEFRGEPTRRCLEELRINSADAVGAAAVTGIALSIGIFPRRDGAVDKQKALATARTVAYRLKGSQADWNGQSFSRLDARILIPPGMVLLTQKLNQIGAAYDDGASDTAQIASKLLVQRAELAIGLEYDVAEMMKRNEFAGKFEILPAPFTETEYYMVFSRQFYADHAEQAENMWKAIAAVRRSPEFAAALRRAGLPPLDLPPLAK